MDPQYLGDVVNDVRRVGQAAGAGEQADSLASRIEARIDAVGQRVSLAAERPKVLTLEWVEPLIATGHWVPEMVELAGGTNCFGDKETASFKLEWDQIVESQPDVIMFMPCGYDVKRTLQDVPLLATRKEWAGATRGPQRAGVRHRRRGLYQPGRPQAGNRPGSYGGDGSPGTVFGHGPRVRRAAAIWELGQGVGGAGVGCARRNVHDCAASSAWSPGRGCAWPPLAALPCCRV